MTSVLRDIESPPGGWRVTVPQTGVTLTAPYAKTLRGKVIQHLVANGYEEDVEDPDFDEWFEDAACVESGHPEPFCGQPLPPLTEMQRLATPAKAVRFMRVMWNWLQSGGKPVPKEEAKHRAAICMECPKAGGMGGCWGCNWLFRKLGRWIAKDPDPVTFPKEKRFCLACGGCILELKTLVPNDILDKAEKGERPDYWEKCWRNEEP